MNKEELIAIKEELTKREYFAAKALQGMLSVYDPQNGLVPNKETALYIAKMSVIAADALLLELSTNEKQQQ